MVWPTTLTRSVSAKKTIRAPVETVLALLHDPNVLFSLNPLVLNVSADSSDPPVYSVTDRLVLFGYFNTQTKYQCTLTIREDGLDTNVLANLGTRLKSHYRVYPGDNGTTELTEHTIIEAYFFSMPYIIPTMSAAHADMFNNLAVMAEKPIQAPTVQVVKSTHLGYHEVFPSAVFFVVPAIISVFAVHYLFPASILLPIVLIILGGLATLFWSRMAHDPYSLFHLSLNKLPGEDPVAPPRTEWLNMGLWKNTDIFPEACAALAIKLMQAANCKENGKVLDVGHGTGESLILLLSDPSIPRPSSVTGITSLSVHHNRSQQRVTQVLSSLKGLKPDVDLYAGDAIYRPANDSHPLDPASSKVFDTILALDCAYHFHTREEFLHQALQKLQPGGRIALADICFDPKLLENCRIWLIVSVLGLMPKQNMVSMEGYIAQMKEIGYADVQLEDVTDDVFFGFINFLKPRGLGWKLFGWVMEWYAKTGTRFVIVSGSRR